MQKFAGTNRYALSDEQIEKAFALRAIDRRYWSYARLAELFGVSKGGIAKIMSGARRGPSCEVKRTASPPAKRAHPKVAGR